MSTQLAVGSAKHLAASRWSLPTTRLPPALRIGSCTEDAAEDSMKNVLWMIAAVLIAIWVVGLIFDIVGAVIHVLLVVAVALFLFGFIKRKVAR